MTLFKANNIREETYAKRKKTKKLQSKHHSLPRLPQKNRKTERKKKDNLTTPDRVKYPKEVQKK